jgi:hypothetical protein
MILQSIEDLWNPEYKGESLMFFEDGGFVLCSEIAEIGYVKQTAVLRMLADAGFEFGYPTPGQRCVEQTARQETQGVVK